jgi:hypothetical protein
MRGGTKVFFEGALGAEEIRPAAAEGIKAGGKESLLFNRFSCKYYFPSDLVRRNGGAVHPLREEDGYFESLGSNRDGEPEWAGTLPPCRRWIHSKTGSREVTFPQEAVGRPLAYSSLAHAYIFQRFNYKVVAGATNRVYLLAPNQDAARVLDIPGTPYWSNLYSLTIARPGLVATSSLPARSSRAKWDPGPAGLYLFRGAPVDEFVRYGDPAARAENDFVAEKLVPGLVDAVSVASPNGCKVAAVIDPWDGEDRKIRLLVVDFCNVGS